MTFSIITPSYNRATLIQNAIESVISQDCNDVEHIIVDGASTDSTLELLASYPHLRVMSEPDHGVYDALNKGLAMAQGEIIGQLNTDDYYQPHVFKQIQDYFAKNPEIDAVCGGARVFENDLDGSERMIAQYEPVELENFLYRVTSGVIIFNAWFFRKKVFNLIGNYSLEYPLMADRDFLIRCWLNKVNIASLDLILYHYRQHSGSLTINSQDNVQTHLRVEAMQLTENYLRVGSLHTDVGKHLIEWHDLTAIELIIDFFRKREFSSLFKTIWSAIKFNPSWPFIIASQSPFRLKNYLKKKYAANR